MKRPNILFAIADDASHMSAYGHQFLNTPHFDSIASSGVLFNNAFTTNPKCAPSRASILTGYHTWQLEEGCCHYGHFPPGFSVYPQVLAASGYHTGLTGKGWAPGSFEKAGFSHNPAGPSYDRHTLQPPADTGIKPTNYAANFKDFLETRPTDQPFCFWYGGYEPHRAYTLGEGRRAGKDPEAMVVPPYWPDRPDVREDLADYAYETEWFDYHLGQMIEHLKAAGEWENTIIVVTSDNGAPFPRIKGQMYEDDFRLPLAISWPEKFPAGRVVNDLVSFIDLAPTFLELAHCPIPSDLPGKSLLNLLESESSGYIDPERAYVLMGRERHDLGREGDLGYPVRCLRDKEYLYVHNLAPDRWPSGNPETGYTDVDSSPTKTAILQERAKGNTGPYELCFAKRPAEELYNIINDPACIENLASESSHIERTVKMRTKLEKLLIEQKDPRALGKEDFFDNYEYVGGASHSWQSYQNGTFTPQGY